MTLLQITIVIHGHCMRCKETIRLFLTAAILEFWLRFFLLRSILA